MNNVEQFLTSDFETQLAALNDAATAKSVESWLGADAFSELYALRSAASHLASKPRNLVFVPGVMGSMLRSELGGVWWIDMPRGRNQLNGLALADNGQDDADSAASITPCALDLSYVPFLRAVASSSDFGPAPFFYDWRKLPIHEVGRLRALINACYQETRRPVHLVGHSMGGLVIRTALMLHGDELWPKIGKVVFLGTPHYGSPAIAGYLKNHLWGFEAMAVLGLYLKRETFRSLWGVLSLLPAPFGIYPGTRSGGQPADHVCANFDMYRAVDWKLDLDSQSTLRLQRVLDAVAQHHRRLYEWHQSRPLEQTERMFVIAGVGYKSLFRLEFDKAFWGLWEKTKKITDRSLGDPHREGDGRVPLASAALEDVTTRYVKAIHGGLPNIPAVSQDVFAWLSDERLALPTTPDGALTTHLGSQEQSSAPHLDGSALADTAGDEVDYYREIDPNTLGALDDALVSGRLPQVNLARLL